MFDAKLYSYRLKKNYKFWCQEGSTISNKLWILFTIWETTSTLIWFNSLFKTTLNFQFVWVQDGCHSVAKTLQFRMVSLF